MTTKPVRKGYTKVICGVCGKEVVAKVSTKTVGRFIPEGHLGTEGTGCRGMFDHDDHTEVEGARN